MELGATGLEPSEGFRALTDMSPSHVTPPDGQILRN